MMGPLAVVVFLLAFQALSAAPVNENGLPAQTEITSSAVSVGSIVAVISGIAIFSVTVFLLVGVTNQAEQAKQAKQEKQEKQARQAERACQCLECCCKIFEFCFDESGGDE